MNSEACNKICSLAYQKDRLIEIIPNLLESNDFTWFLQKKKLYLLDASLFLFQKSTSGYHVFKKDRIGLATVYFPEFKIIQDT